MPRILVFALCLSLLPVLLVAADDNPDDDRSVSVNVRVSALGNVYLSMSSDSRAFLQVLPGVLNCSWLESERSEYHVGGTCRGWLKPGTNTSMNDVSTLRLAPLVTELEKRGAEPVTVNLVVSGDDDLAAPSGWIKPESKRGRSSFLYFTTETTKLPGDVVIPLQARPNLFVPIAVIFAIPVLLGIAARRNVNGASADRKMNWLVWMHWTELGVWLYWISAVHPVEIGDYLLLQAPLGSVILMVLGVAIYSGPLLLSTMACLVAMAPLLSCSQERLQQLLRQQLVSQASIQVPLAIFLVGLGGVQTSFSAPTLSIVLAYVVYRGLAWLNWTMSYAEVTPLESGDIFEQATALARKAGVKISRLGLLRTRVPEHVNAFAMSGDRIVLTESLVRGLTAREVNAVIAHELGHHKAGHLRVNFPNLVFWAGVFALGPLLGWLVSHYRLPAWALTVPIAPLGMIMVQGLLSQRRELEADARAAQITGDPEGKIAALARLAQLSRIPVDGRGIMQSIMSHPSMEKRVLALARRHNVPDARALAILRNPDEAYTDSIGNLAMQLNPAVVPEKSATDDVFNLRAKVGYAEQTRWLFLLAPVAGAFLLGFAIDALLPPITSLDYLTGVRWVSLAALLLAPLPILGLELMLNVLLGKRFVNRLQRKIGERIPHAPHSVFAGIHPGRGVRFTEGFPEWDFGFIALEGDYLIYRGEKARFSVARQHIMSMSIVKERPRWLREHRVEIVYRGGAFTLNLDFAHPSQAAAERAANWISGWVAVGESIRPAYPAPEPPPILPQLPGTTGDRWPWLWFVAKTVVKIWLAAPLLYFTGISVHVLGSVLVTLSAPVAVLLRALPAMLWPNRQIEDPLNEPEPQPAPALAFTYVEMPQAR
jgi:Zn-dependent protease with chaperone function